LALLELASVGFGCGVDYLWLCLPMALLELASVGFGYGVDYLWLCLPMALLELAMALLTAGLWLGYGGLGSDMTMAPQCQMLSAQIYELIGACTSISYFCLLN